METATMGVSEERKKTEKPVGTEQTGALKVTYPKGFGFIAVDDGGRDVFVRQAEVDPELWRLGQRLRFRTLPPVKGKSLCAVDVRAEG